MHPVLQSAHWAVPPGEVCPPRQAVQTPLAKPYSFEQAVQVYVPLAAVVHVAHPGLHAAHTAVPPGEVVPFKHAEQDPFPNP